VAGSEVDLVMLNTKQRVEQVIDRLLDKSISRDDTVYLLLKIIASKLSQEDAYYLLLKD
jgi:hypothetical protein